MVELIGADLNQSRILIPPPFGVRVDDIESSTCWIPANKSLLQIRSALLALNPSYSESDICISLSIPPSLILPAWRLPFAYSNIKQGRRHTPILVLQVSIVATRHKELDYLASLLPSCRITMICIGGVTAISRTTWTEFGPTTRSSPYRLSRAAGREPKSGSTAICPLLQQYTRISGVRAISIRQSGRAFSTYPCAYVLFSVSTPVPNIRQGRSNDFRAGPAVSESVAVAAPACQRKQH